MAVIAALHHRVGSRETKGEVQQNAALRGQTTGARARRWRLTRRTQPHRDRRSLHRKCGQASRWRPCRTALLRGQPAAARHAVSGGCGRRFRRLRHSHLPPLSVAGGEGAGAAVVKRKEEAKEALGAWKQRRKRVKVEFMALLDRTTLSPHDEEKLRELVSRLGSSSASSSAQKKRKRRKRRRRTTTMSWSTRRTVRCCLMSTRCGYFWKLTSRMFPYSVFPSFNSGNSSCVSRWLGVISLFLRGSRPRFLRSNYLLGSTYDTVHTSVYGVLGRISMLREGGLWILGSILVPVPCPHVA